MLSLSPSAIARILGAIASLLVLASIAGQLSTFVFGHDTLKGLVPLFDVDGEHNIPTYFSELLMLVVALLLSAVAVLSRKEKSSHAKAWAFLSFGFLYMAYDEIFMVHEHWDSLTDALMGDSVPKFIYFGWVIPGTALVLVLALVFRGFVLHLPAATRRTFLTAATLYVVGALGGDVLFTGPYGAIYGEQNLTYGLLATVEESLEMAGLIVFIWALLSYVANAYKEVRFQFRGDNLS